MAYINGKKILSVVQTKFLPAVYQSKTITPQNFTPIVTADIGYAALSKVKIDGLLVDAHESYTTQTDSTTAYVKDVPAGALKYSSLDKLGGMSYKSINVWDEQWELGAINNQGIPVSSSIQIRSKDFIKVNSNAQYYFYNGDNTYTIYGFQYDSNYNFISTLNGLNIIVTTASNCAYIKFYVNGHTTYNNDICINVSDASINGNYYPYFEGIRDSAVTSVVSGDNISTIPSQVQALTGYGWGVNANCYNYIDFTTKKFVQKVARVDLGSLNWVYQGNNVFTTTLSPQPYSNYTDGRPMINSLISNNYLKIVNYNVTYASMADKSYVAGSNYYGISAFYIKDSAYTDAEAFKTAMSGVYLYYELATPVETDIIQYIDTNLIKVEPNDTIIFNNNYNQAVPSEVTYLVEV